MRALRCIGLLLLLVLVAAPALAQQGQTPSGAAAPPEGPAATPQAPARQQAPAAQPAQPAQPARPGPAAQVAPSALGQPAYLIEGDVREVNTKKSEVIVSTPRGNQTLRITGSSNLRDNNNQPINLGDISQGDRVFAAFDRRDGENEARLIYKLPK